ERNDFVQRGRHVADIRRRMARIDERMPLGILAQQTRSRADALDLTFHPPLEAVAGRDREELKLDARAAGIYDEDGLWHCYARIGSVVRRLCASSMATAHDAMRVRTLSAREVRMMGTRAPSTMPAASAPDRNVRFFASMLPASRSGTTRIWARPATGDLMPLMRAASGLMALSKASGPSSSAPEIWPRSAILQSAAASIVDGMLGLIVSTADRIATFGMPSPSPA